MAYQARDHLGSGARQCLIEAENEARALDDDHVGTEHIVLGCGGRRSCDCGRLAACGITRDLFRTQLVGEEGPSPDGPISYTPRSMMVVGLGLARRTG
ncbi:Clp protease N-terminal domain-containing protein [Microlunatus endophyticus]|uniref:Clp protease N-terminal domain-containing protein n=1 Tax=Microlunatus endophyticus TaxID=1716077 RepID=UPI0016682396